MPPQNIDREDWVEVEAVFTGWGKGGKYGFVDIVNVDAPTESAICFPDIRGVVTPEDRPFRCFIAPSNRGWRVAEIIVDDLPEEVENLTGRVVYERDGQFRNVYATPSPENPAVQFRFPDKVLWAANLAAIDVETEVCFDASRGDNGYVIGTLRSPTTREAFGATDIAPVAVGKVCKEWEASANAKGVIVGIRGEDSRVAASVFVGAKMLRGAGLNHVVPWDGKSPESNKLAPEMFDYWEDILKNGTETERDDLKIDQLQLALEWVESDAKWRVARLLRPRAVRMPSSEEEQFIDWIEGAVKGDPAEVRRSTEGSNTGDTDDTSDENAGRRKFSVSIRFRDPRVGRGTSDLQIREDYLMAAALADGVQVVMRLRWVKDSWRVDRLHRSQPIISLANR